MLVGSVGCVLEHIVEAGGEVVTPLTPQNDGEASRPSAIPPGTVLVGRYLSLKEAFETGMVSASTPEQRTQLEELRELLGDSGPG